MAIPALDLWFGTGVTDDDDAPETRGHQNHDTGRRPSEASPDAEVVARIRAGDIGAFETIYREHLVSLIAFAASILSDADRARDVTADVFLDLWRQRTGFEAPGGIRPYLYVAVRNRAYNELRARGRAAHWASVLSGDVVAMGEPVPRADEVLEGDERLDAVRRALDVLPEPRRTICRLRFQEGMGFDEIGIAVGLSANAVQQHLSRARRMLRDMLPTAFE